MQITYLIKKARHKIGQMSFMRKLQKGKLLRQKVNQEVLDTRYKNRDRQQMCTREVASQVALCLKIGSYLSM